MAAHRRKSSAHGRLSKHHHTIHFSVLLFGIFIFLILIAISYTFMDDKNALGRSTSVPSCLSIDSSVRKNSGKSFLYYSAKISVPLPEKDNIECRVHYSFNADKKTSLGNVSYTSPVGLRDQNCDGSFDLGKNVPSKGTVKVALTVYNTSKDIEGSTCHTTILLPR